MKNLASIFSICTLLSLVGCTAEEVNFEGPSAAFYPTLVAELTEGSTDAVAVTIASTGELNGVGRVEVTMTNFEHLQTSPAHTNGVLGFEITGRTVLFTVQAMDEDLTRDYTSVFKITNVSGAIKGIAASEFVLKVTNNDGADAITQFPYSEAFEDDLGAFLAYSAAGDAFWDIETGRGYEGTNGVRMSGFGDFPDPNEDWLISPALDLAGASAATLEFYSDGRYTEIPLQVLVSTDYAGIGDPNVATWTALDATLDANYATWDTWVSSGSISLSAYLTPKTYIAFKYESDEQSGAATWTLDDFTITKN